ncbi:MAG TPA: HDOD domain-containing protein [Steroidobacteraceae bacterium]|nr:HDOD domain-containing protein [Steroidobacteraceae bacterium]
MNQPARPQDPELDRILHAAMTDDSLELPPPPQVAVEVQRLTRSEVEDDAKLAANSAELANLIQRDVALAGQVMRVANSALYARRTPVVTLPQAIAWLGMREIRTITFSAAVQSQVFASTYFRKEMTELWRESVITALFAQEVARLKRRNVEAAYLCGLLHRVGHAVVLARVGSAALKNRLTPDVAQIMPFAHKHEARVGTLLAACWNLPPAVSAAIAHWRDPQEANEHRTEVMEVALARQISDELRTPGAGGELPDSMLGPVSLWMDELSIYPDELFTIMAQRAAIYATAESFS